MLGDLRESIHAISESIGLSVRVLPFSRGAGGAYVVTARYTPLFGGSSEESEGWHRHAPFSCRIAHASLDKGGSYPENQHTVSRIYKYFSFYGRSIGIVL